MKMSARILLWTLSFSSVCLIWFCVFRRFVFFLLAIGGWLAAPLCIFSLKRKRKSVLNAQHLNYEIMWMVQKRCKRINRRDKCVCILQSAVSFQRNTSEDGFRCFQFIRLLQWTENEKNVFGCTFYISLLLSIYFFSLLIKRDYKSLGPWLNNKNRFRI